MSEAALRTSTSGADGARHSHDRPAPDPRLLALARQDRWLGVVLDIERWSEVQRDPNAPSIQSPTGMAATIREGLRRALEDHGHLALPATDLLPVLRKLLREETIDEVMVHRGVRALLTAGYAVAHGEMLALPDAAATEASLAMHIRKLLANPVVLSPDKQALIARRLATSILSEEQQRALWAAFRQRFLVVTGPAGVGKSVVIHELVHMAEYLGERVAVAAPTGKAADVLVLRGVRQAQTQHSLLGLTPTDTPKRGWPAEMPLLIGDRLVLDEQTMVDAVLFQRTLAAVPPDMSVVLFGDVDQLPPVGAGSPFEHLVTADPPVVPVVRIETVRRATGAILSNAQRIREGRTPQYTETSPFYDAHQVPEAHRLLAKAALGRRAMPTAIEHHAIALWIRDLVWNQYARCNPLALLDVQVLTPQTTGPLGTGALAGLLRDLVNPAPADGKELRWKYGVKPRAGEPDDRPRVRVGDEVIAIETIAQFGVRNGQTGRIVAIDDDGRHMTLQCPDLPPLRLPTRVIGNFALRYALTIHRAQGSEYPIVVQLLHEATVASLATRRLFYTGYTRARNISAIVGTESRVRQAIDNAHSDRRTGTLVARIRGR